MIEKTTIMGAIVPGSIGEGPVPHASLKLEFHISASISGKRINPYAIIDALPYEIVRELAYYSIKHALDPCAWTFVQAPKDLLGESIWNLLEAPLPLPQVLKAEVSESRAQSLEPQ